MTKIAGRPRGLPKTGGRVKGTPNRVSQDLRAAINDFLDANWPKIQSDFNKMDPKDRLGFIEKLMSYALPKLSAATIDARVETETKLSNMSDEQLNRLIDHVIEEAE